MSETKTLHKLFWIWEFEKEERWLNEMAQEGWALTQAGFCTYTFEKGEPGEYIIRLEMIDNSPKFQSFMEELGEFNMFSDIDSRVEHLNKIGKTLFLLCMANIVIGITGCTGAISSRMGWLNLLCAALLAYGLGRIHGMRDGLKNERSLHE